MVFEFTVWHIEFNSKLYDVVSWNQSIYVFQCISDIDVYIYYTVYTLIELAFQKRKFRHQLYQVVCCFCRVRSCGEYAGSLLGVWRSRGFQSEVVVLEILSWVAIIGNLLLSSLTSLISYWCPRYGCACVLLFPLCHLADRHRFAARCCKAWLHTVWSGATAYRNWSPD